MQRRKKRHAKLQNERLKKKRPQELRQRRKKQREDRDVSSAEVGSWKAELRELLSQRVNTGVSARYIAGGLGGVDMSGLVRGEGGAFLGASGGLDLWGDG